MIITIILDVFRLNSSAFWAKLMAFGFQALPRGSVVVPFCGSYLGCEKVIPKRNYNGAYITL